VLAESVPEVHVVLLVASVSEDSTTLVNAASVATCQSDEAWVRPAEPENAEAVKLGVRLLPVEPLAGALIVGVATEATAAAVVKLTVVE